MNTIELNCRKQVVRIHNHVSVPRVLMLELHKVVWYTNKCQTSVKLLKFADDIAVVGLLSDSNNSAYRSEVK